MDSRTYGVILLLITSSLLGVIGIQFYWLKNQFVVKKQALKQDGLSAIGQLDTYIRNSINSQANIDGDQLENIDLYYESPDSTLEVILQGVTRKQNLDGSSHEMDRSILDVRLRQFQAYIEHMVANKPFSDSTLGENYLILYGQKDMTKSREKNWEVLNQNFQLDSMLANILKAKNITSSYDFGIYNIEEDFWEFKNTENNKLIHSEIHNTFYDEELEMYLEFINPNQQVLKAMTLPLILSALLILTILASMFFMYYVIMRQKQVSEIKNDFINNMTHEFKTPLATIAFATANIENPSFIQDENMIRKFTAVIKSENKRMNQQVEQVLGAAVSDQKGIHLNKATVDIHSLIKEIATSSSMQFQKEQDRLKLELSAANHKVHGDILHLRNMFSNLIDNAYKYSPEGGEIQIRTVSSLKELTILVIDHGIGMKKEVQRRIFEKFYRVPTGYLHNIKGFGLGLNYAKAVAEQHQGSLVVESKYGQGSIFTVKLPI